MDSGLATNQSAAADLDPGVSLLGTHEIDGAPESRSPTVSVSYGQRFIQSASAGPGELLHVAVSLSAVLPIQIVPPGQVTETSFSPALHKSSHLVSHAVSVSACKPAVPAGPA